MEDVTSGELSVLLSAVAQPLSQDDFPLDFSTNGDIEDSLGNSPSSLFSFEDECSSPLSTSTGELDLNATSSFSSYDLLTDPSIAFPSKDQSENPPHVIRRPVMVRKRMRECSMVCWLFRTLLTSEYRALPVNAIFEIFEDTVGSHGRHWRQSIRHCLLSSAVFVRVLTPNPRKDFLVMNDAGSWWTVHPNVETACADDVFRPGLSHKCPPNSNQSLLSLRMRPYCLPEGLTHLAQKNLPNGKTPANQRKQQPLRSHSLRLVGLKTPNPIRGDHLVVDHEEEVVG